MENILKLINEETFVISDHHFGHKNVNKFEPIRLKRAEELGYFSSEQMMINEWNKVVGKEDTVLHLGDFAFSGVEKYMNKLNGKKILIYGNHDKGQLSTSYKAVRGFYIEWNDTFLINPSEDDKLHSGIIKSFQDKFIMFSHYPLNYNDKWDNQKEKIKNRIEKYNKLYEDFCCDFLIHGHVHSNEKEVERHFNVSCEVLDFKPIQIKEIIEKMEI